MLGNARWRNSRGWCEMSRCTQSGRASSSRSRWRAPPTSRGASSARCRCGHEAAPVRQQQQAALAAHGFADQEGLGVRVVQAGGVELDELHVATRQPARQAAAMPSPVAVSGLVVYRYTLPAPPVARMVCGRGRSPPCRCVRPARTGPGSVQAGPPGPLAGGDQVHQGVVLEHGDVGLRTTSISVFARRRRWRRWRCTMRRALWPPSRVRCRSSPSSVKMARPGCAASRWLGAFSTTKRVVAGSTGPRRPPGYRPGCGRKAVVVGQHGGNAALRPPLEPSQLALGDDRHAVRGPDAVRWRGPPGRCLQSIRQSRRCHG